MKIGDNVRVGAPYQYGFAGESTIAGQIQRIDDDIVSIKTKNSTVHVTLRYVLFIEIITKEVETSETRNEQQPPTA